MASEQIDPDPRPDVQPDEQLELSRDEALAADDLPFERVDFPEGIAGWAGRCLYVRSMTSGERDQWESFLVSRQENDKVAGDDVRATLVAMTAANSRGELLFSLDDVKLLQDKAATAADLICTAARKLNRLNTKDLEELEKN